MNSAEKVQSHPFKDTASLRSDHVSASHDGAVHTEERSELSSLIVPERSQAKDLIVFESQKRTWFGALNDGVTTALNYISSSIAIGYATRIGCSHEKKFKILDQLLNSKDASTFEVVLDKMKITQASVLSFFSTRDPVKAFERILHD